MLNKGLPKLGQKKLQVRNLSHSVESWELEDLFTTVGTVVSAKISKDPGSGLGLGIGFVEMSTEQEAADCVERFNGYPYLGQTLVVIEDRPHVPQKKRPVSKRSQAALNKRAVDANSKELSARIRAAIISSRK